MLLVSRMPFGATLITERSRLVGGNPRTDPPICAANPSPAQSVLATRERMI
jgi:hypothetical protein